MSIIGTNAGHGHAWERPDGLTNRCGGPGLCQECADDQDMVSEGANAIHAATTDALADFDIGSEMVSTVAVDVLRAAAARMEQGSTAARQLEAWAEHLIALDIGTARADQA